MNTALLLISIFGILLTILLVYLLIQFKRKLKHYETEYKDIIDIDSEIERKNSEFDKSKKDIEKTIQELQKSFDSLKSKYEKALEFYNQLSKENSLLQDNLEIADYGMYEPHFDFESSEIFKSKIIDIRARQKELIKNNDAVYGGQNWTVNNSLAKGQTMINRQKRLMMRAFNGECDSFISNVAWNNVKRMEERISKSKEAINKMGDTQGLTITWDYEKLKLEELRLTYEYKLKKYQEKEEQNEIKARMREEEKAIRDFEKAQKEAEKEEKLLQEAMKKAKNEMQKATEEERKKYEEQLEELEKKLKEAEEKNQRAISMAQQTRSGHVYVISNIGAFGENIFKIGMTRRLEPLDRVNELGDASVPFKFDVHAMIYSEDAPELENQLHKAFENNRLNFVNRRREYFDIELEEIKKVVIENHGEIEFIMDAEAKEYRESQIIRESMMGSASKKDKTAAFPNTEDIFN